ncbi:TetR/AcrR family transcriptional regulator [Sphingobacterium faecale]|uniref:TetR/AcrR family transcriptional regulator n=1 Tax=Sphingobacterium faecale TaxID=2803775 RepID=A0ABS1R348_9SPHI|nr:TetR/AcrR family transcriptional regulator [Sphingobacterium faecale]MBL1409123.1 TetR/AcrR family transcriptional regulator [Sphingobacterium faecale]
MSTTTRREREIQELRSKIITQSWKIITEDGWQALSIRKIADAIEYSAPVIYKHFESKEAIIEYFSKEGFNILSHKMSLIPEDKIDSSERLRDIAYTYWKFASTYVQHYRIMFGLGIPPCEAINSSKEMQRTSNYMYSAIEQVLNDSANHIADKYLKIKTFWSTLHGFVAIALLSDDHIPSAPTPTLIDAVEGFIFTLKNNK